MPFRIIWVISIFFGVVVRLSLVWTLADVLNGLMVISNLVALLLLSPVIFKITHEYILRKKNP